MTEMDDARREQIRALRREHPIRAVAGGRAPSAAAWNAYSDALDDLLAENDRLRAGEGPARIGNALERIADALESSTPAKAWRWQ
jgi:hypothetical protein